jgi:hypothetical protein
MTIRRDATLTLAARDVPCCLDVGMHVCSAASWLDGEIAGKSYHVLRYPCLCSDATECRDEA